MTGHGLEAVTGACDHKARLSLPLVLPLDRLHQLEAVPVIEGMPGRGVAPDQRRSDSGVGFMNNLSRVLNFDFNINVRLKACMFELS